MAKLDPRSPEFKNLPDSELVRLAQDEPGSRSSLEAAHLLLTRHQDKVYAWCFRYVRDHERALDVSQEALLDAWRGLPGFRGEAGFTSWLFAITRRRCFRKIRRFPSLIHDDDIDPEPSPDPAPSPDLQLAMAQDEEQLLKLVRDHLDPLERVALWLRCIEGMAVDDISTALGVDSASGARGLLQTARRKLRAVLAGKRIKPKEDSS